MTMGFTEHTSHSEDIDAVKHLFSPEFRNRLDAVIPFKPLTETILKSVVDKFIIELEAQLEPKHVKLKVDAASRQFLSTHGYDKKMGARPMARLIQEKLKKPLAEELLFGRLSSGGVAQVTVKNGELHLSIHARQHALV
jgi:ATP-dependent Clp protease ATP-binding subunit ClpA